MRKSGYYWVIFVEGELPEIAYYCHQDFWNKKYAGKFKDDDGDLRGDENDVFKVLHEEPLMPPKCP